MKLKPIIIKLRLPNTDHMCYMELNTQNGGAMYLDNIEFYISHGNNHKELVFTLPLENIEKVTFSKKMFANGFLNIYTYDKNPNLLNLQIDSEWYSKKDIKKFKSLFM